ncbi:hypothetical protein D9B85_05570 [Corynebacterium diphtheriae]|nr:hypothetical protein D9B36_05540 [Corynebacterium diphtheriae]RKX01491.1 hypothetical protein D9B85_05570 [Corynebacterium diphtheriae]RLP09450.1 hypothetical protein D9R17_06150 [Corynebacterium diphtheriae]RLP17932.1 hypothetical protein D9R19_05515 [Corynebacterium diphtheriae]
MSMTYRTLDCHMPWLKFIDWVMEGAPMNRSLHLNDVKEELLALAKFTCHDTNDEFEAEMCRFRAAEGLACFWPSIHPSQRARVVGKYFELTGFKPDADPFGHITAYMPEEDLITDQAKEYGCENIFRFIGAFQDSLVREQFLQLISQYPRLRQVFIESCAVIGETDGVDPSEGRRAGRILELYLASNPAFTKWWKTITG